jgi:hypothetical protein
MPDQARLRDSRAEVVSVRMRLDAINLLLVHCYIDC